MSARDVEDIVHDLKGAAHVLQLMIGGQISSGLVFREDGWRAAQTSNAYALAIPAAEVEGAWKAGVMS
jgi:hypothetical protein